MNSKWVVVVLAFAVLVAVGIAAATDVLPDAKSLTVHEWGTFTSVAGREGEAVAWLPVDRQSDLPCFVNQSQPGLKYYLSGTVRMETPVLYFYTSREMNVDATVRFPKGWITEWHPEAQVANHAFEDDKVSTLEWRGVRVSPGAAPVFPVESGPSHYYAARQTDAAQVRVSDQNEKFLFYRGVGDFPVPLRAEVVENGKIRLSSIGEASVPGVALFENRDGKRGYRAIGAIKGSVTVDPPTLNGDFAALQRELERILVETGLYPREAAAMVATWRDSWFEVGTRVFYIVPPASVDANLPLSVDPRPVKTVRTFVGRMEVITRTTEAAVADAIRTSNDSALAPYRRFLRPIVDRLLEKSPDDKYRTRLERLSEVLFDDTTIATYQGPSVCSEERVGR